MDEAVVSFNWGYFPIEDETTRELRVADDGEYIYITLVDDKNLTAMLNLKAATALAYVLLQAVEEVKENEVNKDE